MYLRIGLWEKIGYLWLAEGLVEMMEMGCQRDLLGLMMGCGFLQGLEIGCSLWAWL